MKNKYDESSPQVTSISGKRGQGNFTNDIQEIQSQNSQNSEGRSNGSKVGGLTQKIKSLKIEEDSPQIGTGNNFLELKPNQYNKKKSIQT